MLSGCLLISEGVVEARFADFEARGGLTDGQAIADVSFGLFNLSERDNGLTPTFSAAARGGL